jgi:hypothetical protein
LKQQPDVSTITVCADWDTIYTGTSWVSNGDSYQIYDYHLTISSPCIDAGDNDAPELPDENFEGDPRKVDVPCVPDTGNGTPPIVDMGADEYKD